MFLIDKYYGWINFTIISTDDSPFSKGFTVNERLQVVLKKIAKNRTDLKNIQFCYNVWFTLQKFLCLFVICYKHVSKCMVLQNSKTITLNFSQLFYISFKLGPPIFCVYTPTYSKIL